MKVKELIEKLKEFDPEEEVYYLDIEEYDREIQPTEYGYWTVEGVVKSFIDEANEAVTIY